METRQQRYEQTDKGKKARRKAVSNYKAKLVRWETMIEPELSDALLAYKPDDTSKAAFIKTIFQGYLDSVGIQDTY